MKQLDLTQMELHVTILGWLHLIGSLISLAIAIFLYVLLTGIGVASGDSTAMMVLSVVGTSLGILLTILGIPGLAAGYGLLARRSWGRILAVVVGFFNLVNFPLGTAIGLYTLWVLLQDAAADYFAPLKPA
jgi:hypothetical protein